MKQTILLFVVAAKALLRDGYVTITRLLRRTGPSSRTQHSWAIVHVNRFHSGFVIVKVVVQQ